MQSIYTCEWLPMQCIDGPGLSVQAHRGGPDGGIPLKDGMELAA